MNNYLLDLFEMELNHITQLAGAHGGGIHLVEDSAGKKIVAKLYKDACFNNHVNTEVEGLELLAKRCQDIKGLTVPAVIKSTSCGFLMEYIPVVQGSGQDYERAGVAVAQMHSLFEDYYGLKDGDNFIGPMAQVNGPSSDWGRFFFDNRLTFQASYTRNELIMDKLQANEEKIIQILNESQPQASLLHGDLWGGNLIFDKQGNAILIDPAVYFGDREAELVMTRLFGGFLPDFYTGYTSVLPKRDGEELRDGIYSLYHLLNHLNIFGESFMTQVKNRLNEIERL